MSALENIVGKFKEFGPTSWSIKNKKSPEGARIQHPFFVTFYKIETRTLKRHQSY